MANKVILVGRLGKDPEMTFTAQQLAICKFSLATSEKITDKSTNAKTERVEWHNIVAFGKQGETIRQYVNKGQQLYIEGKIHYNKWEDKEGHSRITTEIIVDRFEFIGNKAAGGAPSKDPGQKPPPEDIPF